ncbi:MAG TPA: hypothetical protein VJG64_00650 [Candidatus Paceibacterota bacterium]
MTDMLIGSIPWIFFLIIGSAFALAPQLRMLEWVLQRLYKNYDSFRLNNRGYRLVRLIGMGVTVASFMMLGGIWIDYKDMVFSSHVLTVFGVSVIILLTGAMFATVLLLLIKPQLWWKEQSKLYENPEKLAPSKAGFMAWRIFALAILAIMVFYALRIWTGL